ncbi:MAG TPA: GIY-YIG nuclease family protein [Terriglobales bacterium]|nr:GIY-YIG nuclease family protein [Terriglobales bacterium]
MYIIANATRILYTGMCNNLHKRVWQHKTKQFEGFTSHFHVCRLVYWESFDDVRDAINREKQIKRWRRAKKIWLIERMNRNWKDLSDGWYDHVAGKAKALPLDSGLVATLPRPRSG